MIQKDYIMRLAEQVAQILARLLGKDLLEIRPQIEAIYTDYLPLDRAELLACPPEELQAYLQKNPNLEPPHIETLADLLYFEGMQLHEQEENNQSHDFLRKAEQTFLYLDQIQGVYSFERQSKLVSIRAIIVNS